MMKWIRAALPAATLFMAIHTAEAQTNLVANGGFENTTLPGAGQFTNQVTGWSTTGYNFLFTGVFNATTYGDVSGQYGFLYLWGTYGVGGASNGFASSPNGGNFVGADGAYDVAAITQTINGLVPGQTYALSFDYAGAQQAGYYSATTEQWKVSLGNTTQFTPVLHNVNEGFTGWSHQVFDFVATSVSEVLSFVAIGTPSGVPPFALLDGVSMQQATAIPEPSSTVFLVGGAGLAAIRRLRTRKTGKSDTTP